MQFSCSISRTRKAVCIAAGALCALLAFAAFCPTQAHAARAYGSLCSKYESGNNPACIDPNCAYGAYQMSPGHAYTYATWLKTGAGYSSGGDNYKTCVKWGKKLLKGYKKDGGYTGSKFDTAWRACNSANSTLFFNTQYTYCLNHYYNEAVKYWKIIAKGFDPNDYSVALRSALFSTAIQHGPYGSGYYILKNALKDVGGWKKGMGEDVLINAIYYERSQAVSYAPKSGAVKITSSSAKKYGIYGKYLLHFYSNSSAVQVGVYNRLHNNERKDALKMMLNAGVKCTHGYTKGGKKTYTKSKATNTTHYVTTAAVYCTTCGKKDSKKKKESHAKHEFSRYSGKNVLCACGYAQVIAKAGKYYRTTAITALRESAKRSAKQAGTLAKGLMVKAEQVKTGSDHNYWVKVTVGSISGWASISTLSIHGNGSKGHVFENGKCKFCKATQLLTMYTKTGKYKATKKTYFYKAAYAASGKQGRITKGKNVKVTKVVRNNAGSLWGKTKNGYINLSLFKNKKIKLPASALVGNDTSADSALATSLMSVDGASELELPAVSGAESLAEAAEK